MSSLMFDSPENSSHRFPTSPMKETKQSYPDPVISYGEENKETMIHLARIAQTILETNDNGFQKITHNGYCPDTDPLKRSVLLNTLDKWLGRFTSIFQEMIFFSVAKRELAILSKEEAILTKKIGSNPQEDRIEYVQRNEGVIEKFCSKTGNLVLKTYQLAIFAFKFLKQTFYYGSLLVLSKLQKLFGDRVKKIEYMIKYLEQENRVKATGRSAKLEPQDTDANSLCIRFMITDQAKPMFEKVKKDIMMRVILRVVAVVAIIIGSLGYFYGSNVALGIALVGILAANLGAYLLPKKEIIANDQKNLAKSMKDMLDNGRSYFFYRRDDSKDLKIKTYF